MTGATTVEKQGYIWVQQDWLLLPLKVQLVKNRDQSGAWYNTISWFNQLPMKWQVDRIEPFPSWKGERFIFTGINISSRCGFSFPALRAMPPSGGYQNACSTGSYLLLAQYLTGGLLYSEGGAAWTMTWDTLVLSHFTWPRGSQPHRTLDRPSKAQIKCHLWGTL